VATLAEVLKDTQHFPDNVAFTTANGVQTTIGELRSLSAAQLKVVTDREAVVAAKEAALQKSLDELGRAQQTTAQLFAKVTADQEKLEAALKANGNNGGNSGNNGQPDPLERLESDQILGPLVKYTRAETVALKAELAATKKANEDILKAVQTMGQSYLNDRLTDQYDKLVPADKKANLPLQQLIKHAMDNKYTNSSGYVDIVRSYNELTASDQRSAIVADADKAGYERAMKEMQEKGIIVRPPSGGGGSGVFSGQSAGHTDSNFKNLDEAFAAAAKDADLWREFNTGQLTVQ